LTGLASDPPSATWPGTGAGLLTSPRPRLRQRKVGAVEELAGHAPGLYDSINVTRVEGALVTFGLAQRDQSVDAFGPTRAQLHFLPEPTENG
jgi:hypothetical protein